MLNIQNYGSSSEDEEDNGTETTKGQSNEKLLTHLKPVDANFSVAKSMQICAAPVVMPTVSIFLRTMQATMQLTNDISDLLQEDVNTIFPHII